MASYTVASPEGAARAAQFLGADDEIKVGDTVALELTADQERALIAAGWLETPKNKKKEE